MAAAEASRATAMKRIQRELEELGREPVAMCNAAPRGDDLFDWVGAIRGPPDSCYEGGVFYLSITFPLNYPFAPPKCRFTTPVYHPNIHAQGGICLDILKDWGWSPILTLAKVLLSLCSLLCDPNPNHPLDLAAASLYRRDREAFNRNARDLVRLHAMSGAPDTTATTSTTTTATTATTTTTATTATTTTATTATTATDTAPIAPVA